MSVANFSRFLFDMAKAFVWEARHQYYRLAYRTIGDDHPDSWIVCHRMVWARVNANDLLRKHLR